MPLSLKTLLLWDLIAWIQKRISCLYLRHGVCLEFSRPPLIDGGVLDLHLLCLGRSYVPSSAMSIFQADCCA